MTDASYGGIKIGSATVDIWQASDGSAAWCARILVEMSTLPERGLFAGTTREGRILSGQCRVGNGVLGPSSRTKQIVEILGEGELSG
jgi:hypothetical protein